MKQVFIAIISVLVVSGCASTKVERIQPEKQIDLAGDWNDTDSRLVASQMIQKALAGEWLKEYTDKNNKLPVVVVGTIKNNTDEHIEYSTFVNSLQEALINSGKIKFVAAKDTRGELRQERQDQSANAAKETINPSGQELGADFMLMGQIASVKDQEKNKASIYYQVTLEMVNLTTNEKVWLSQKEIKKLVTRSSFSL